jgi:hypothetical protein
MTNPTLTEARVKRFLAAVEAQPHIDTAAGALDLIFRGLAGDDELTLCRVALDALTKIPAGAATVSVQLLLVEAVGAILEIPPVDAPDDYLSQCLRVDEFELELADAVGRLPWAAQLASARMSLNARTR